MIPEERIRLVGSPVSWGIDFPDHPDNPPWERVLDEIAVVGFEYVELGPRGYLPEDGGTVARALGDRGLQAAGSWLILPFEDDALGTGGLVERATPVLEWIAAAGGIFVVLIDQPSDDRSRTAGASDRALRLSPGGHRSFLSGLQAIATAARREGLRPVFHPHTASYVEFEDEIDWLMAETEPDCIGLCLDTGHLIYSGADPGRALSRHMPRLEYLHLKDADLVTLNAAIAKGSDFWSAVYDGVFCPIGRGAVDFRDVAGILARAEWTGFATLEQDRDPKTSASALRQVGASLRALGEQGLGIR